ncbi:SpaA isopeptide-forming pilin-related protein [Clostridium baratii]
MFNKIKKNYKKVISFLVLFAIGISIIPTEYVQAFNPNRDKENKIIEQYIKGVKMLDEQIEARKEKAKELNLLDYVDDRYFLTDKWYEGRSEAEINEIGANILVDTVTEEELDSWANNLKEGIKPYTVTKYEMVSYGGSTVGKYEVDGRMAFCAQHNATSPAKGSPTSNARINNKDTVRKVLYYGYGGPKQLSDMKGNYGWVTTSLGLSYAYTGKGGDKAKAFVNRVSKLAAPPSSFKVYIVDTNGGRTQDLAYWKYSPKGTLQIEKSSAVPSMTNGNNCYSLNGAVYGVYKNSNATNKVGELKTNASGKSNILTLDAGVYYIKEITPPKGFALDKKIYSIRVNEGKLSVGKYKDKPQADPIGVVLKKIDASTGISKPIDGASLKDARFTLKWFKGHYDVNPETKGIKPDYTWVFKTDKDGVILFDEEYKVSGPAFWYINSIPVLPLGTVTVQELNPPNGYKINPEVFVRKITSQGTVEAVNTYNEPIVKEESLDFKIKKIDSETKKPLGNVTFKHVKPNGSFEEIKTNSNGEIVIRGLEKGIHKIVETQTLDGYELNSNEFIFEVTENNTIKVISNTTGMDMSYKDVNGNGELTVENKVKPRPFKIKVIKMNEKDTVLEGAEFTLYSDKECKNEVGKAISNANGELEFSNLQVGVKYYFKETNPPPGYSIPVDPNGNPHVYEVVVTKNNWVTGEFITIIDGKEYTQNSTNGDIHVEGNEKDRVISIKVVNYTSMKLPATGSKAMIPLLVLGISLIGVAFVLSNKNKKKEKEKK